MLVLLAGLFALALIAASALMQRAPRRAGTNMVPDAGLAVTLEPSQELCQTGEVLPPDTASLAIRAVASSGRALPALQVLISAEDSATVAGGLGAGRPSGTVRLALARVAGELDGARVCFHNSGSEPVSIGGSDVAAGDAATLDGTPLAGRARIEYMRPGSESWFQLLPTLGHRLSLGKSDAVRKWAAGAALVLVVLAVAFAAAAVLGQGRSTARMAVLCALVALANGLAWSLIVPPLPGARRVCALRLCPATGGTRHAPSSGVPGRTALTARGCHAWGPRHLPDSRASRKPGTRDAGSTAGHRSRGGKAAERPWQR